jgi:thiol:disulfide interchange protein DsbD
MTFVAALRPLLRPRRGTLTACALAFAGALVAASVHAEAVSGLAQSLLPADRAFRLSARALDASTIEARYDIADGYYLYRDKLQFRTAPVTSGAPQLPTGVRKHDAFFGEVDTYRREVVVRIPLEKRAAGEKLTLDADSQGCADAGVCYPPNPQQLTLTVPTTGYPGPYVEPGRKGWFK